MKKVAFITLGCRANQAETDAMRRTAVEKGYLIAGKNEKADISVINTCTVTALADKKSRQAIRNSIKKSGKVFVTGCMADTDIEQLKAITGIDKIFVNAEKKHFDRFLPNLQPATSNLQPSKIRANLLIQTGCENFCTYCIVPYARGKEKSLGLNEAVAQAKALVKNGTKEIILTGINIGAYDKLPDLISELAKLDGLERIRLSSIEPERITLELLHCIANEPKVCRYLHIPLQSGDDTVLRKMGRKYDHREYSKLIGMIRDVIPGIAVSTDMIVGFPGETDENHAHSLALAQKLRFTRLHVFRYSSRKGTPAAEMPDPVTEKVIEIRSKQMQKLREGLMLSYHKSLAGKDLPVLIEQRDKKTGLLEGLTSDFVRVLFKGPDGYIGKIVSVKIGRTYAGSVEGVLKVQSS